MDSDVIIPEMRVCCLERLEQEISDFRPTQVVSCIDPGMKIAELLRTSINFEHAIFMFFDGDDEHQKPAIQEIIEGFIGELHKLEQCKPQQDIRLLIHCIAGASRSPAMTYIALAYFLGTSHEYEAFDSLLALTNKPWPNLLVVDIADKVLNLKGRLIEPLANYRQKYPKRISAYRRLNVKRGMMSTGLWHMPTNP